MDAVVRWSLHRTSDHPRFLILNLTEHNLKFFEARAIVGKTLDYSQLSQQSKLPNIRAFDWSPTDEALVAIGLPSGEATLLRIDENASHLLSFTVKHQRLCNAISLSTKGLLAAGLDKVRNDFCLNIWDINYRLSSWDKKKTGWSSTKPQSEPVRKLASSETISSIKFFSDQPDSLVTGVKGLYVRVYDLRDSPGNPSIQFTTRCAHNISIDSFDENYFASGSSGGEPLVCVWDRRVTFRASAAALSSGNSAVDSYQAGAVLELKNCLSNDDPSKPPSLWSVRYSKYRRASLGILGNNGQLRVYETSKEYRPPDEPENPDKPLLLRTEISHDVQFPWKTEAGTDVTDRRVVSFDFMASGSRIIGYRADGSLEVFTLKPQPPLCDMSVRGEMVVIQKEVHIMTPRKPETTSVGHMVKKIRSTVSVASRNAELEKLSRTDETLNGARKIQSHREGQLKLLDLVGPASFRMPLRDVLTLHTVERRRVQEGYLFDSTKNLGVIAENAGLRELWLWVEGAEEAARDGGMSYGRLDLSFLGVRAVIEGDLGPRYAARISEEDGRPPKRREFIEAVTAINRHFDRPKFEGVNTAFPEQRQLGLAICGWALSDEELEAEFSQFQKEGNATKAAARALFHGLPKQAMNAVIRGNDSEKLIAMALAGYYGMSGLSKNGNDEAWADLCREVAATAHDPWSRAILSMVSREDWSAVIAETSLPMTDRVGVALKYLPDDDIMGFLDELTADCVKAGDLDGICLTGISEGATDLFQEYIIRTNDVQTAVLVMSFAIPLYVNDYRFQYWQRDYRDRLDRYRLHMQGCLYDTQHTKKSQTRDGRVLIKPPARQVTIRCNFCDQSVAHDDASDQDSVTIASAPSSNTATAGGGAPHSTLTSHPGKPFRGAASGILCPKCNRHLPRCGVCLMWLGVPDPRVASASTIVENEDPMERFLNVCNICQHGFHAHHARDWFERHQMCPVPECSCMCAAGEPSRAITVSA